MMLVVLVWMFISVILLVLIPLYIYIKAPPAIPLPGPKQYPFPLSAILHLFAIRKFHGAHRIQYELAKQYGKLYQARFYGRTPTICVADPEMAKKIMVKEFYKFRNRGFPFELPPPMDSELFLSKYNKWKRLRKVVSPIFSGAKLKGTAELVMDAASRLISKLEQFSKTGESVEMSDLIKLSVLDVILSSSFGVDTTELQTGKDRTLINRANTLFSRPFLTAIASLCPCIVKYVDVLGNAGYFMDLASAIIHERQQLGYTGRYDVAQLMIDANKTVVDGESRLNDNEMKGISLSFLVAGYDTTSTVLICTCYFLATNQHVQEKLVQEIQTATENHEGSVYDLAHSIAYLDWVLKEVIRLCPPGHRHLRECVDECCIDGIKFPKGTPVHILAYAIHHDPAIWPDPFKFDPERFHPEEVAKRHPFSYLPFGEGPRQCIGSRYAMMVMKILLVKVLGAGFRFEKSPDTIPMPMMSFQIMRPKPPIHLKIIKVQ